jgi:hypothetical protein
LQRSGERLNFPKKLLYSEGAGGRGNGDAKEGDLSNSTRER